MADPAAMVQPGQEAPSFLASFAKVFLIFGGMQVITKNFGPSASSSNATRTIQKITPYDAEQMTIAKREQLLNSETSALHKAMGLKDMKPGGNFVVPIFPTHDANGNPLGPTHRCTMPTTTIFDLWVFLTEHEQFSYQRDQNQLAWIVSGITFNWEYKDTPSKTVNITMTPSLLNNGTYYAHAYFTFPSYNLVMTDPSHPQYDPLAFVYKRIPLVKFQKKRKIKVLKKLLDSKSSITASNTAEEGKGEGKGEQPSTNLTLTNNTSESDVIVGYWCPTLALSLVLDMPTFSRNTIPTVMAKSMEFSPDGNYYPIVYRNNFWIQSKEMLEINATHTYLPLKLSYAPIASWKWTLQQSMEDQWEMQQRSGLGTEKDADLMRETLLETSPWLLGLTFVVSLLHMLFDFLAFKNDIQFWRKKKTMTGMSVRTLAVNCFFQTVIFLYLLDNDTSTLILLSTGVGLLIEYWKLHKAFNFRLVPHYPFLTWCVADSYSGDTQEHDAVATTHLLYLMMPLIAGYSVYSLLHNAHKSFYSWALGSLVGFVYAFGFVMMTPQLYINYKLKSVAHIPWKAMVYKTIGTFIDDLFAFIIKMPILHRLSCFRDDLIFFVYLYQRWIYRVDYTRTNEFGQQGDPEGETESLTEVETEGMEGVDKVVLIEPKTLVDTRTEGKDEGKGEGKEGKQSMNTVTTTRTAKDAATVMSEID